MHCTGTESNAAPSVLPNQLLTHPKLQNEKVDEPSLEGGVI